MKQVNTRLLLLTGLLIPIIFWGSTIVAAILHGNYNHVRDTISELGAVGTGSEKFMEITTWICSLLGIPFLAGLLITCRRFNLNRIPLVGIAGFSIMMGWAATYHSGNPMHSKSGPVLLILILGPLLAAVLWRNNKLKKLRAFSLLSFFIMLFILLRAIPSETLQQNYTGLIQRFVHLGWSVWFVSLSLSFLTLSNKQPAKIP